ncbi:glycosyltransferase [Nocardioides sediminis]|uniref:glycosyltransferase n=1 Tax=Nocardioides sediminis TaxID=433648 RepID=UPI000D2FEA83|nr:glycosyltransferase [Nocardioides sediminis]
MIPGVLPETVLEALAQRLEVAAEHLGWSGELPDPPAARAVALLGGVSGVLPPRPGPEVWLFLVATLGRMPTATEVESSARVLDLDGGAALTTHVLELALRQPSGLRVDLEMEVVTDRVVVCADYCAREDNHTGVQRVARAVAERWRTAHDVVAVADIDERTAYRNLAPREEARVYHYGRDVDVDPSHERSYRARLVVPYRTTVVFAEVMHEDTAPTNLALAHYSGNTTCAIGYDTIPILSSSLRPPEDPGVFTRYLSVVKHLSRIAAISASASAEFQGFVDMLVAQGLPGPGVHTVVLASEIDRHVAPPASRPADAPPLVVVPSRLEAHKNVLMAVQAAHRLWRDGLDFELVLLGGPGRGQELVLDAIREIEAEGHPIRALGWVDDDVMWQALTDAAFAVFVSLHEGYGLPIVEALSCGTPVLTSDFGAQAEIARGGGCVTTDPRNLTAVADAMRLLVCSPELRAQLAAEIPQRPVKSWDDYAVELWECLVEPAGGPR